MARITVASLQAQLDIANEVCRNLRTTVANRDRTIDDLAACVEDRDATIAALEAQLAMSKEVFDQACITIAAQAERLDNAVVAFKQLRSQLRDATAAPVVAIAPQPKAAPVPTVTHYYDAAGQLWERTRYSATRSIARPVPVAEYDAQAA